MHLMSEVTMFLRRLLSWRRLVVLSFLVAAVLLIPVALAANPQEPGKKKAVPETAIQEKARGVITRLYAAKFKAAYTDQAAAKKLAAELLAQAKSTSDDDQLQF